MWNDKDFRFEIYIFVKEYQRVEKNGILIKTSTIVLLKKKKKKLNSIYETFNQYEQLF